MDCKPSVWREVEVASSMNPEAFDLAVINKSLAALRAPRQLH
jgi:hypothetical protein